MKLMFRTRIVSIVTIAVVSLFSICIMACGSDPVPAAPVAPYVAPTAVPAVAATAAPAATAVVKVAAAPSTGPVKGGTLRVAKTFNFDAPDPAYTIRSGMRSILHIVYGTLVEKSPSGELVPGLAKSWQVSADGKSIDMDLQSGVKFQDGTPFDAKAVKWNFDRFLDPDVGSVRRSALSPPLNSVSIVDDDTIRFNLSQPFRPFLSALTMRDGGNMASPTAVEKANSYADREGEFGKNPVGAGPFIMTEWVPGSHFDFEANPNYWEEGLPYLNGINMKIIPNDQIQFAMVRTGELDAIRYVGQDDLVKARRNPKLNALVMEGSLAVTINFKLEKPPFNNESLRHALTHGIDREVLASKVFRGGAIPAQNMIAPANGGAWHDSSYVGPNYDPQKVKQHLADAGHSDGFEFIFRCRSLTMWTNFCEGVQAMLSPLGIDMKIEMHEPSGYFGAFARGDHDGPVGLYFTPRPDPQILLKAMYHSEGAWAKLWEYSNSEVDKILNQAEGEYDQSKASQLLHDVDTIVMSDASMIYPVWLNNNYVLDGKVKNYPLIVDSVPRLGRVWIEKE